GDHRRRHQLYRPPRGADGPPAIGAAPQPSLLPGSALQPSMLRCFPVVDSRTGGVVAGTEIHDLKAQQKQLHHVSEHLANERTVLAWIRTAIAVMTFGVGINRFSLFLVEFGKVVPWAGHAENVHAEQLGIGLVGL